MNQVFSLIFNFSKNAKIACNFSTVMPPWWKNYQRELILKYFASLIAADMLSVIEQKQTGKQPVINWIWNSFS